MDNEELERKMEFIVEHQAQSTARLDRLEEIVTRLGNFTLGQLEHVDEKFRDVDERISALVDSQIRLSEAQKLTDESLRNLIAVVDRYFSGNGRSENRSS
jgi:hypothetical protein